MPPPGAGAAPGSVLRTARSWRLVGYAGGAAVLAAGTGAVVASYAGASISTSGFAAFNFAEPTAGSGLPGGLGAPRAGDLGGPGPHLRDGVVGRSPGGPQRRPHRRRAGAAAAFEIPAPLRARLDADAEASSADLRRASGLMERTLDYLAGGSAHPHAGRPGRQALVREHPVEALLGRAQ